MLHLDKDKAEKCVTALESLGFYEERNGISITFDRNFQKTYDATSVLSKEGDCWHYFVFERGSEFDNVYFLDTDAALNFLFWSFTNPEPDYSIIYRDYGPGIDELIDSEYVKAFIFACNHLGISPRRYHIDAGDEPHLGNESPWVCSKTEKGWRVLHARPGGEDFAGDFDKVYHALEFMFWTLTGAETYQQRYEKISSVG